MSTTSDGSTKSLSIFATEQLVEQVMVKGTNESKSIMPEFYLRGEAAIEVFTGVKMRSGKSSFGDHKIKCYSVQADAPQADRFEIYEALRKFAVQPPGTAKGLWDFTAIQDTQEATNSMFLFRQSGYDRSGKPPTPVKITLVGDIRKSLQRLISSTYIDPECYTFKPSHLSFRIYSPTLILVQLLKGLPVSGTITDDDRSMRSIHLILLLLEKGFKPALHDETKENGNATEGSVRAQFSSSACLGVLRALRLDVLIRAEQSAIKLSQTFAPVCASILSYRNRDTLPGTVDTFAIKSLLRDLCRIFEAYKHTMKRLAAEERVKAGYGAYHPHSSSYSQASPPFHSSSSHYDPRYNPYHAHARPQPQPQTYHAAPTGYGFNPSPRTW